MRAKFQILREALAEHLKLLGKPPEGPAIARVPALPQHPDKAGGHQPELVGGGTSYFFDVFASSAGIVLLPDQGAIGRHRAVGTEYLVEIEPKRAPGNEESNGTTAASGDAAAGPGNYAADDFELIDKIGGPQVEDDVRKDVALGLDGAPHEPAGREIAVNEHSGVAQRNEVLGNERIEDDFEVAAAFERPQGQIVAQRFDLDFEEAGVRFEGEQVQAHVLDRRVEGLVEFIGDLVASVLLESLALTVDDGPSDRIIDLIDGVFSGGKQQVKKRWSRSLGIEDELAAASGDAPAQIDLNVPAFGGIVQMWMPASGEIAIHDQRRIS
ncbi:MAG: hypothetical protein F4184_01215 [Gemmatimonadetes bacterium]|nr:hypothetical protein [Gemmatimonadota bacterium]